MLYPKQHSYLHKFSYKKVEMTHPVGIGKNAAIDATSNDTQKFATASTTRLPTVSLELKPLLFSLSFTTAEVSMSISDVFFLVSLFTISNRITLESLSKYSRMVFPFFYIY